MAALRDTPLWLCSHMRVMQTTLAIRTKVWVCFATYTHTHTDTHRHTQAHTQKTEQLQVRARPTRYTRKHTHTQKNNEPRPTVPMHQDDAPTRSSCRDELRGFQQKRFDAKPTDIGHGHVEIFKFLPSHPPSPHPPTHSLTHSPNFNQKTTTHHEKQNIWAQQKRKGLE
jgi:hypothetical protein